ncbi:GNAT family N-acetyltransferase [Paenibacillus sinopodophylli]|uniref:GNAT family N-acetyltransferase n=1 Tax=Paenibacillus sinopodophylli TaxID=1837342 RepID=UPI001FEA74FA|nr:GNAT family protein [Paenibacillus sinopodophylli]
MTLFSFEFFPRMETERFILRKSEERDITDLYELYSDQEVIKYTLLQPFLDHNEARQEMNWYHEIFEQQIGIRWLIEDKATGKMIGTCGFLHYVKEYARSEIGYDLVPAYWRRGIMSEVAAPIIAFGFDTLQLHCIEAKVDVVNAASIGLLSKLGFKQDRELIEYEFEAGQFIELLHFAMLRRDYRRLWLP